MTHTSTEQSERLRANLIAALCSATEDVKLSAEECQHLGKIISNQRDRVQELEFAREIARACSIGINKASQAQRVPLSDAQIEQAMEWCDVCEGDHVLGAFSAGVRHVEKLYGITQEKQGCKKEGS